MLNKVLTALREEGYDAHMIKDVIFVSVEEFDLYRITVSNEIIKIRSVDTNRVVFFNYNDFLYFLES